MPQLMNESDIGVALFDSKQVANIKFISWSVSRGVFPTGKEKKAIAGCIQFREIDTASFPRTNVPSLTVLAHEGGKTVVFHGLNIMYSGYSVAIEDLAANKIYTFIADEIETSDI